MLNLKLALCMAFFLACGCCTNEEKKATRFEKHNSVAGVYAHGK